MEKIKTLGRQISQKFETPKEGNYQSLNDTKDVLPVPDLPSGSKREADPIQKLLYTEGKIKSKEAKELYDQGVDTLRNKIQGREQTKLDSSTSPTFGERFNKIHETTVKSFEKNEKEKQSNSIMELGLSRKAGKSSYEILQKGLGQLNKDVNALLQHASEDRGEGTSTRRPEK